MPYQDRTLEVQGVRETGNKVNEVREAILFLFMIAPPVTYQVWSVERAGTGQGLHGGFPVGRVARSPMQQKDGLACAGGEIVCPVAFDGG